MNAADLIIPLNGLASGKHIVEGSIDKRFFEDFENHDILGAGLDVNITIEKSGSASVMVTCSVKGFVTVTCDRCLEELELPVGFSRRLTVKFSADDTQEDVSDDVMIMNQSDCDLDMSQFIYDYVMLCIPIRKVHAEGGCNKAVMDILNAPHAMGDGESGTASPFAALKGLFDNGKEI